MEQYFAQMDSEDLAKHLMAFNGEWNNITTPYQNGIGAVWARNINYYYNNILAGDSQSALNFDGQLGELVKMVVPQARSLNTQFLSLTTKQKLYFEPMALSSDASTLADTRIAQALCDKIVKDQFLDQKAYRLAELCSLTGASYIRSCWNMSKGAQMGMNQDGTVAYSGGLKMSIHSCYDISFDHRKEDFYEQDWVQVKYLESRWNLIATYPQFEEAIRKLPKAFQESDSVFYWQMNMDEDQVWVYEFIHRSSPALPLGRYTLYCDPSTVFYDEHNPYKDDGGAYIPISEMKPEPIAGTGFGYPIFSNILPLQEMLDHNFSAISSNNNAFAVKSILNPIGNDINVKHIQGLKFINYRPMNVQGSGKPEVLDLNSSNPEIYKFNDTIVATMQQIMSINSAIRGEPGAGITSGTAIATLSANALEFAQNFSKSYINCLETAVMHGILAYRNFASEPEIVAIAGPNDSTIAKEFVGSDLADIKRIDCQVSNPLMATAAGKLEIANNLLQTGQFSVKRYLKILEGAPIESLYDREFDEENFIQEENDALRKEDGPAVIALAGDDHPLHMQAHNALLNNLAVRNNPALNQKIMDHIYQHFELAKTTDPLMYQMIKTGQMPDMQQMQAMQMQELQMSQPPTPPVAPEELAAAGPAQPAEAPGSVENQDMGGLTPLPQVGA